MMTPQPTGSPPQQSFFQQFKWPLIGGGCLLLVMCCAGTAFLGAVANENPGNGSARVDCGTPGPEGVDCVVKRTGAGGGLRPCWDLEITCQNGGVMVGSACGELPNDTNGEETTVNMPVSAFSNQEGCDAPKSGAVKNLIVHPMK
ncbi:MAG: hypothetical protein QM817_19940 [Archangium sp.]